jgi:alpha-tubulin suppressor-like RCC1 family protein
MKRATKLFALALLFLLLVGAVLWWLLRPVAPVSFAVGPPLSGITTKPSLACGMFFAAMVAPDGSLWAWGNPTAGNVPVPAGEVPRRLGSDKDWKQVTAGFYGLLALKHDGSLWVLGQNGEGVLGVTNAQINKLTMRSDSNWSDVRSGVAHCMALKNDGALWLWGRNKNSEIALGKTSNSELPTRFGSDTNWKSISPGDFGCYALKGDGTIWGWGSDFITTRNIGPTQLGPDTNWIAISSGDYHLAALKSDGTIWAIGANAGIITPGTSNPATNWVQVGSSTDWVEIRSGQNNILARKKDGSWWATGHTEFEPWAGRRDSDGFVKLPFTQEPLAMHSQRGTTLLLMPDGRLWTLGLRIGASDSADLLTKARGVVTGFLNLFSGNSPTSRTAVQDRKPYLIWEAQKAE